MVDARAAPGGLGVWQLDIHGFTVATPPPPPSKGFLDRRSTEREYGPALVEIAKKLM